MPDIYQAAVLNRIVQDLKVIAPIPFLLQKFFPEVSVSNQEEIFFDVMTGKARLSPFVSPMAEGQIVQGLGYTTKSFSPAYVKDKRVLEDGKSLRRRAGQPIYGPIDPMAQRAADLAANSADQLQMLYRRLEWMASEVMRTGSVTVTGEKYPTTVVNFGRDAALTVTLSGGALWSAPSTATPLKNLEDWGALILAKSGAAAIDVVMAQDAYSAFRADPEITALMSPVSIDTRTRLNLGPDLQRNGAVLKGQVGDFRIWVYAQSYINDAGAAAKFLPDNYVLMASDDGVNGVEGVQHFGAIKDEAAGFQATDYFSKSWTTPDPGVRWLLLQSAPLVVPYRINATLAAKVL